MMNQGLRDAEICTDAPREPVRLFKQHQVFARSGEGSTVIYQLLEGSAYGSRQLPNGRRQITALFLPGDYCEPQWLLGPTVSCDIVACATVRARLLPLSSLGGQGGREADVQQILASILQCYERQTEWLVRLGRQTAVERVASLLYEIFERMRAAGLTYANQCAMHQTQADFADILGLTSVHINRVLKDLREMGLVELQAKWLRLPDIAKLREIAGAEIPS